MATVNTNFFNFDASLFSNGSAQSGREYGGSNILGDYASIRNGSYKKLLTAYYAKQKAEKSGSENKNGSVSLSSSSGKSVTVMQQDAKVLMTASDRLRNRGEDSLFRKTTTTLTDSVSGEKKETTGYRMEEMFSGVETFIKAYNSLIDSTGEIGSGLVSKKMAISAKLMETNAGMLKDVGVTIGKDNKLSINKEEFMKSDISALRSLFNGPNSISDKMVKRANDIYSTAEKILTGASGGYTKSATLSKGMNTGTLVNELL